MQPFILQSKKAETGLLFLHNHHPLVIKNVRFINGLYLINTSGRKPMTKETPSLDDIAQGLASGTSVNLTMQVEDAQQEWNFYLLMEAAETKPQKYHLRQAAKHELSNVPFDHDYHQKMLGIGDSLYPNGGEHKFAWKNREEQFALLMSYVTGLENPEHSPDSKNIFRIYEKISRAVVALKQAGCTVSFAGSEEKAEKLAALTEIL